MISEVKWFKAVKARRQWANKEKAWPGRLQLCSSYSYSWILVVSCLLTCWQCVSCVMYHVRHKMWHNVWQTIGRFHAVQSILQCFDSTAWNRYYSIVRNTVSWHCTGPEHKFGNGLTFAEKPWFWSLPYSNNSLLVLCSCLALVQIIICWFCFNAWYSVWIMNHCPLLLCRCGI